MYLSNSSISRLSIASYFSSLPGVIIAASSSPTKPSINSFTSASVSCFSNSYFTTSNCVRNLSCSAQISFILSCPNIIASSITSSETSFAPASTIVTASFVPATDSSISLTSSCSGVGFKMYSPSIYPTVTPATVPANGISDNPKATETPIVARFSG